MNLKLLILPLVWLAVANTKPSENRQEGHVSDQGAWLSAGRSKLSENRQDPQFKGLAVLGSLPVWLTIAQTAQSENRQEDNIADQGLLDDQDREILTDKLVSDTSAREDLNNNVELLEKVEEMFTDEQLELDEEVLLLMPQILLEELEGNAKKAGCARGCLECLAVIKCTEKMNEFIPGRCHKFPGIDETNQGAIGDIIVDIPEIVGFIEMEPLAQFNSQVDKCTECSTRCLKGLANVKCTEMMAKWFPNRCAGFAGVFQDAQGEILGNPFEMETQNISKSSWEI